MRNAPERSITRTPRSSSVGASSADAASGSARNTTSASAASRSTSSGDDRAVPDRASAGSGRGALEAPDDIAAVSVDRGMARKDAHQLLAGKAGRAGDGDAGARGVRGAGSGRSWSCRMWQSSVRHGSSLRVEREKNIYTGGA